jgi:hypothetical protein
MNQYDDREILADAARAAGIDVVWHERWGCMAYQGAPLVIGDGGQSRNVWTPLEDDGDAFRLAVELKLGRPNFDWDRLVMGYIGARQNQLPTVRRGIVEAAAEIGRALCGLNLKQANVLLELNSRDSMGLFLHKYPIKEFRHFHFKSEDEMRYAIEDGWTPAEPCKHLNKKWPVGSPRVTCADCGEVLP